MARSKEARLKANKKYQAANAVQIHLSLNRTADADILAKLDSVGNKQGYIKGLVRKDIAEGSQEGTTEDGGQL